MRRRRTRRRVQDTLRSDRSADSRTGAGANAAEEGPEKQRPLRILTPTALIMVLLAIAVREDDNCPQDTISPRCASARRSSNVRVTICAMLGTAPAATSPPARTTVTNARLIENPRRSDRRFLWAGSASGSFACNFRTRASNTELLGIYSNRERSPWRY
jgi:hypothetical protein